MDIKQFQTFQTAIQWAVDESERYNTYDEFVASGGTSVMEHDQSVWCIGDVVMSAPPIKIKNILGGRTYQVICPTSGCVAGNIVLTAGDQFVASSDAPFDHELQTSLCYSPETNLVYEISERAEYLAGLTEDEADRLFGAELDIDRIVQLAYDIARAHGYTLELV